MGAQQSSTRTDASQDAAPQKICYYELLAVDRQATDEEIKKAYRRKALELHPDRNLDNVAVATQKFAEVQTAYEVLSDPQERAWYDSHRESILRGNDGLDDNEQPATFQNVRLTTTEEIHNLISRFNATTPFTDEPTGFFGIVRETFEHLALEEEAAASFDGVEYPDYPTFGSSGDDYDSTVKPFYAAWAGFTTRKSFTWKDKYRLSDAADRRVRRLMEKENKKCREEAMREFNDAVRFLVTFVRKRDPRYLPNTQTQSERQKSMRDAAAAQAAKARAANKEKLRAFEVPSWAESRRDGVEDDHFPETEEESETEVLECVVCNKAFKSEKQLQVHEQSKKHVKAVQKLRWQMKKEGAELDIDNGKGETTGLDQLDDVIEDEKDEEHSVISSSHDERGDLSAGRSVASEATGQSDDGSVSSNLDDDGILEDDDYAPRSTVQRRFGADKQSTASATLDNEVAKSELVAPTENVSLQDTQPKKKVGKAKAKREKRAAENASKANVHRCTVCNEEFTSRTKLFDHIRDADHAAPVPLNHSKGKGKKKR